MRARTLTLLALAAVGLTAPSAARAADVQLTEIAPSSFDDPVYVTSPPDDPSRVFVVDEGGTIRLLTGDTAPTLFLAVPDVQSNGGEQGLLSMAFAPDYATSGRLYVYYIDATACEGSPASCDIRIDEYRSAGGAASTVDPATRRMVLRIAHRSAPNHNGGHLQFGPDGYLYVATGDGGGAGDPENNAQNLGVLLGKLLRIDPRGTGDGDYTIPAGNPFVASPPARPEIWAYGLRNPWRFSFDEFTRDLVLADVGQDVREEVNLVPAGFGRGGNFEWNACEGDIAFPPNPPNGPTFDPCAFADPARVPPTLTYGHGEFQQPGDLPCGGSVIGGAVVRDLRLPTYAGRYLYGDLCHQEVWTVDLKAGSPAAVHGTIQATELMPGTGVTSISQDAACRIYITSWDNRVRRVDPAPGTPTGPEGCAKPPPSPPDTGGAPPGGGDSAPGATMDQAASVDRRPPVIASVGMVRSSFAVGIGPTAINATPKGTAFRFTLSEAGTLTLRIDRARLGRRVGRRCLVATRARRGRPGCTRLVLAGSLRRHLNAGRRSVPFSGRIGSRALAPGHYRATITARDAAGNVSPPHVLKFSIVRG